MITSSGITHIWHRNSQCSRTRPPLEQKKIHKQKKWPVPRCIALSTKTTLQLLLAGLHPTTLVIKNSRGWEAEGVEEEAKV
jgi:hypothetical protein